MTDDIIQSLDFDYSINWIASTEKYHSNQSCLIGILYATFAIIQLRERSDFTSIYSSNEYSREKKFLEKQN